MAETAKLELAREVYRQGRIRMLREKYEKCHHEQVKECLKRQIENLEKEQHLLCNKK